MNQQTSIQERESATKANSQEAVGLLQRKCDCGNHTIGGGECESCVADKEGRLNRKSVSSTRPNGVPPVVHEVLSSYGQPLDAASRNFFEPRFGHDFSSVRVHTNAQAAESAQALNARAFTAGSQVVFGSGMYAPASPLGAGLLAHELAHVVQQRNLPRHPASPGLGQVDDTYEREADAHAAIVAVGGTPLAHASLPSPRVQRSFLSGLAAVLLFIPHLFGSEVFPAEDLQNYLSGLRQRRRPENGIFSDNKARACVSREHEFGPYDTQTKILLIQEMLGGFTSSFDEGAIITLMRRSEPERPQIVAAIGRDRLWSKFSGQNRRIIEALTLTAADAGDALVERLRNLAPDERQTYAGIVTDPALRESVRRATTLANITAPVPADATITPAGEANFTINGVRVIVGPDRINPSLGDHGFTHGDFHFDIPREIPITPDNANLTMGTIPPLEITITVWTEFPSEEAKRLPSAYGVGTRPQDRPTLQYHERAHGEAFFNFLRTNPPPVFTGTSSMTVPQFNAAVQQWRAATTAYGRSAGDFALRAGDCVGRLPTDEQLRGTGIRASICHQR